LTPALTKGDSAEIEEVKAVYCEEDKLDIVKIK